MKLVFILLFLLMSSTSQARSQDLAILHESIKRIDQLLIYYNDEVKPLLKRYKKNSHVVFDRNENEKIDQFWTQLIDHRIALHTIYNSRKGLDASYENDLILYSVNLHLQFSAVILAQDLWDIPGARQKLNKTNTREVPRGSYISMVNELFRSVRNTKGMNLNDIPTLFPTYALAVDQTQFYKTRDLAVDKSDIALKIEQLNEVVEKRYEAYQTFVLSSLNMRVLKFRFLKYQFKSIFYKLMTKISTWLGDTKTRNRNPDYYNGQTLIDLKLAQEIQKKVRPGDIMISRTNWFLSNLFLPGFWMHSFIYTGTPTEFKAYFNTAEVNEHYLLKCLEEVLPCTDLQGYLANSAATKKAWQAFLIKDQYGHENALIEATSEGVHFSSIRHTFLNDYLGAMRPRTSKLTKAMSIEDAMASFDLEYDFDFDYDTDDRLVCSELVIKSFYKREGKPESLSINYDIDKGLYLKMVMGRSTLPVINLVRKIYDENVVGMRARELDFVAFLKGDPRKKTAYFMSEDEFYKTRNYPKWDFMQ